MSAVQSSTVMSAPIAAAPASGTATIARIFWYPSDGDDCGYYEIRYTGGAEANNVTIGGNIQLSGDDGYEDYCPNTVADIGVVDTGATIDLVSPGCTAAASVGECGADVFDLAVVGT